MDEVIISAALVGSWPTRQQTPYIPISPEEIAQSAVEAWREGAAIVHIHVRDDEGKVVCDVGRYRRVVELIGEAGCDVIVNLSTGGGAGTTALEDRANPVSLKPELASLDCGSVNFGDRVFLNPPDFLERLATEMKEKGVKPEIECFEAGMIGNAMRLIDKGLIDPPYWFQFVLGVRGAAPATAKQLLHMVESIPAGTPWSVCGISRYQLPMNVLAIAMGGHPRTGMEDNIYYRKGELASSNAQLVARLARIARECGREPATPDQARAILGIGRK